MADDWLERAQRVVADPNLDPAKRAKLEAKIAARAGGGGGPGGVPLRQGAEPMPDIDQFELDAKAAEAALAQSAPQQERLPTAYRPLNERAVAAPIMYQETGGDEGWRQAMEQSDREGRPAYRVRDEFPLSFDPSTWTPETLAVRAALAGGALGSGIDKSLSLGAGGKGLAAGAEALGLRGAGQAVDEAREASPITAGVGRIAGAMSPMGAAGRIGAGANALAGVGRSAGLAGNLGRAALGGGLAGAVQAGGEELVAGGSGEDIGSAMQGGGGIGALLGPLAYGLGRLGASQQRSLRDPNTELGRDLVRAEQAGAKPQFGFNAIKPSPEMQALAEEGRATGGYSAEAMAVNKAVPLLGQRLAEQQDEVLGGIKSQNEALSQSAGQTSLQPVLGKALSTIRKATYSDGTLLPGVNVRGVADVAKRSADMRLVSRTSPETAAAGENTMDVGLARKLGLLSRAASSTDGEMVVVLQPKQVGVSELDVMTRALDDMGAVGGGVDKLKARPFKALGASAREARSGLGPEVEAAKAQQAEQLNQVGNSFEAAGLPRRSDGVDLSDVGTRNALAGGVRRFRSDTNLPNDEELARLSHLQQPGTPTVRTQLGEALDTAAGTGAARRVQSRADLKLAIGQGGAGLPAAAFTGMRLRLDPIMGAFGAMPPGLAPATSTELARQLRRRR